MYTWKLYHLVFRLTRLASQPSHPQVMAGEHKKLTEKYQQAKQEIQYSQTTLARVEMDMEKTRIVDIQVMYIFQGRSQLYFERK